MKSEICPVCKGSGRLSALHSIPKLMLVPQKSKVTQKEAKLCHGCSGKGWIEVHEEISYNLPDKLTRQEKKKNDGWYCYTCNKWHNKGQICSR